MKLSFQLLRFLSRWNASSQLLLWSSSLFQKKMESLQSSTFQIGKINSNHRALDKFIYKSCKPHSPTFQSFTLKKTRHSNSSIVSFPPHTFPVQGTDRTAISYQSILFKGIILFQGDLNFRSAFHISIKKRWQYSVDKKQGKWLKNQSMEMLSRDTVGLWADSFPGWKIRNNSGNRSETPEVRYDVWETCSK